MNPRELMLVILSILAVVTLEGVLFACFYRSGYHKGYISGLRDAISRAAPYQNFSNRKHAVTKHFDQEERKHMKAESVRIVSTHPPRKEHYNESYYNQR